MEIKVKELRIGNLLKDKYSNEIIKVNGITESDIFFTGNFTKEWQAEPIEITEEWLLKFGFKETKEDKKIKWFTKNRLDIVLGEDNFIVFDHLVLKHLKYIHQLQNLHFALTQRELNVV